MTTNLEAPGGDVDVKVGDLGEVLLGEEVGEVVVGDEGGHLLVGRLEEVLLRHVRAVARHCVVRVLGAAGGQFNRLRKFKKNRPKNNSWK